LDFLVKTVLVPNAPWPAPNVKLEKRPAKTIRIKHENTGLDYFLSQNEELKPAKKHNTRDKLSGRFTSH
jgi:hypothetical protein